MRKYVIGLVGAVLAVALFWSSSSRAAQGGPAVGEPAPDFTLTDLDGETVRLEDLKGKVVYLDFWATWCPPCRAALPHTQNIANRQEVEDGKLLVLAINLREDPAAVTQFMNDHEFSFRVPLDSDGAVGTEYKVRGIPTFVVIDREGKVTWTASGFGEETATAIDQAIESALDVD